MMNVTSKKHPKKFNIFCLFVPKNLGVLVKIYQVCKTKSMNIFYFFCIVCTRKHFAEKSDKCDYLKLLISNGVIHLSCILTVDFFLCTLKSIQHSMVEIICVLMDVTKLWNHLDIFEFSS